MKISFDNAYRRFTLALIIVSISSLLALVIVETTLRWTGHRILKQAEYISVGENIDDNDPLLGYRLRPGSTRLVTSGYGRGMVQTTTPCLDLMPFFENTDRELYFIPHDLHWTKAGHDLSARSIQEFLKSNALS